ncbi:MAG: glycoside hydrolase family 57 protein [Candidatus Zixiibacteriota bacterium]
MLKVAFLWHMHQPYYRDPQSGNMALPWVRLHALKDYYDLPARIGNYENLKMTFNLVPSLLEQIDLYCDGQSTDRHFELTTRPTNSLNSHEKMEVFKIFFQANQETMIDPYPCYRRIFRKFHDCNSDADLAVRTSTVQEIRDLIVWANLVWVDPILRRREPFKSLFSKGEKFTEEDKSALVHAQLSLMSEIVPVYKSLMELNKIEVSFSPYFHPILPLLCDTDSAREALPGIVLPQNRFCHPEDARRQVILAIEMYQDKFGRDLKGMWPSEGSISEPVAEILIENGLKWMASDEQVLYNSAQKSGIDRSESGTHNVYKYKSSGGEIHLFFRDHALSDKIGFVYSGWEANRAVNDFMSQLYRLNDILGADDNHVVPIILDGENCWEFYANDGDEFLNLLFEQLSSDTRIETVTMSEAAEKVQSKPLKRIFAGSWINSNFRIWIGHAEDNLAWDLLWEARRALYKFRDEHPDFDVKIIGRAEKSLMAAEGSDWNWWYGDEHRGTQNDLFDQIYRKHIGFIYTLLGLEIPRNVLSPITKAVPVSYITSPECTVTPKIDGKLTSYYEWLGAGKFDCIKAGGAMHRVDRAIKELYFVADEEYLYFRVDFTKKGFLVDNRHLSLKIDIINPGQGQFIFSNDEMRQVPDWVKDKGDILFGIDDIAEVGLKRSMFFPEGRGDLFFRLGVVENDQELEIWPEGDPIHFAVLKEGEDIIWDL